MVDMYSNETAVMGLQPVNEPWQFTPVDWLKVNTSTDAATCLCHERQSLVYWRVGALYRRTQRF